MVLHIVKRDPRFKDGFIFALWRLPANETVEKPFFALRKLPGGTQQASWGVSMRLGSGYPSPGATGAPKNADFPDIVHHCEPRTRPLYIHFGFRAQREVVHVLVNAKIGKPRGANAAFGGVEAACRPGI